MTSRFGYGYHPPINEYIRSHKCRKIMEIGVDNGDNAREMIECAKENLPAEEVEYYGFDTFGGSSNESAIEYIRNKLQKTGARIRLYKGDSTKILPISIGNLPKMDMIFIDGGHAYSTVVRDWENCKHLVDNHTAIFFHNYELPGPRKVINSMPMEEYSIELLDSPLDCETALVRKRPNNSSEFFKKTN